MSEALIDAARELTDRVLEEDPERLRHCAAVAARARSKVIVTLFYVSSNAGGQQKRDPCAKRTRSCAFRLTRSGPPPKQDEGSHWRCLLSYRESN